MKVLFIGGNGNISWWCVQKALEAGHEVYELNRALTRVTRRAVQPGVKELISDVRNEEEVKEVLNNQEFDVVCDFICFNAEQARQAIRLFKKKCQQYIVISSEAVYQRQTENLPFTEDSPLYDYDVKDDYIKGKLEVEHAFKEAYKKDRLPVTVVRPGYTYDTIIQVPIGQNCFTAPRRLLEGYPYLIPGDGENLLAPLHSRDFANAFVELFGVNEAIGECFHITAEKYITQNEMAECILSALGCDINNVKHIPYDVAVSIEGFYSEVVNRQHMWHYLFDLTKIKSIAKDWRQTVNFKDGIKETVAWLLEDERRQRIKESCDEKIMKLYEEYGCRGGKR